MAYPNSQYTEAIESSIVVAKVELADTLDAVLALQKDHMAKGKGPARLQNPVVMAIQLLKHSRSASFDKAKVLGAILAYRRRARRRGGRPCELRKHPRGPAGFPEVPGLERHGAHGGQGPPERRRRGQSPGLSRRL